MFVQLHTTHSLAIQSLCDYHMNQLHRAGASDRAGQILTLLMHMDNTNKTPSHTFTIAMAAMHAMPIGLIWLARSSARLQ